ncbi:MAG: hypothetical protein LBE06_08890, partial [Azoarcus sp.]|nr:hypothetical protein [Azoarcus sp.]
MLVERYIKVKGSGKDKEIRADIERTDNANPSLRNKKDLSNSSSIPSPRRPGWMRNGSPSSP